MKKQFLIPIAIVCLLASTGKAQSLDAAPVANDKGQRPPMSAEDKSVKEANKAEKELGLNPEQKSKWQAAALTRISANKPLIEKMQGSTTPDERKKLKSEIRNNGQTFDKTVNAMLTPEQTVKWQTWKGNKKKEMNKKMKEKKWSEDEFED
jgi:hypothetical protein